MTKWIRAFMGQLPSLKERQEILDQVAFYNFADVMLDGSRMPLSSNRDFDVQHARVKFDRLCKGLKPGLIVVLSYRLWNHLPLHGKKGRGIGSFETWLYEFDATESLALSLPHPCSSAWRSADVHAALKNAIARVR